MPEAGRVGDRRGRRRTAAVCARASGGIMARMLLHPAPPRPALALLLAPLLAGSLAACGGADPVPSGDRPLVVQPDNPSVASSVADPLTPRIISIVVDEGRTTGDTGVVELKRNVPVRLVVIADDTGTVVVEGYGLRALAVAGSPVQLEFIASQPGEFAVVLEDADLELTRLRVR